MRFFLYFFTIFAIPLIIGAAVAYFTALKYHNAFLDDAVRRGHAEWVKDDSGSAKKVFKWKEVIQP